MSYCWPLNFITALIHVIIYLMLKLRGRVDITLLTVQYSEVCWKCSKVIKYWEMRHTNNVGSQNGNKPLSRF